jgi:hypothetical protein
LVIAACGDRRGMLFSRRALPANFVRCLNSEWPNFNRPPLNSEAARLNQAETRRVLILALRRKVKRTETSRYSKRRLFWAVIGCLRK